MPDTSLYEEEHYPTPLQATWSEFRQRHVAVAGLGILIFFIIMAILGPLLTPFEVQFFWPCLTYCHVTPNNSLLL